MEIDVIDTAPDQKLHHAILYQCPSLTDEEASWEGDCYGDANMPNALKSCNGGTIAAAWAIGGDNIYFPEEAGFPMGEDAGNGGGSFVYG